MPGGATPYREWKVVRFHRWLERRSLTQYALLTGAYILLVTATVMALIWWSVPHAWLPQPPGLFALAFVPGFTVAWTAWQTRQREQPIEMEGGRLDSTL